MTLSGQTGIRLREALARGDAAGAAAEVPSLDEAHRIELLLGAALRDARDDWAAARAWLDAEAGRADWATVTTRLCTAEPDLALDELASAYVAEGLVPNEWRAEGRPLDPATRDTFAGPEPDVAVAAAFAAGVAGNALLDAFAAHPLHAAVAHYYRRGTIHALGPRPLLVLAAASGSAKV